MLKALMEGKEGINKTCQEEGWAQGPAGVAAGPAGLHGAGVFPVCAGSPQQHCRVWILGGNHQHPCAGAGVAQHSFGGEGESSLMHLHEEGPHPESQAKCCGSGCWWIPSSPAPSVIQQVSQLARLVPAWSAACGCASVNSVQNLFVLGFPLGPGGAG